MNKHLAAMAAAGSVAFGAAAARAAVLSESFTMQASSITARPVDDAVEFSFSVYKTPFDPSPGRNLPESDRRPVFDRLRLSESDVGRTIFVPASQVRGAVEQLTNGINNAISWELSSNVGVNGATFGEFPFLHHTNQPFDFAGQEITQIGVRVNELRLNDPASGMYSFSLNLVVVPEPSAPFPLGVAGLVLLRRRRAPRPEPE